MEMLCIGVLGGIIVSMVIFAGGIEYAVHKAKHDGDSDSGVCDSLGGGDDSCTLGNIHKSKDSGQDMVMDAEVATIALDNIQRDLNDLISATERRAIEYAIYTINNSRTLTPSDIEAHAEKLGVKLGA